MMKKALALTLAVIMLAAALAGCSAAPTANISANIRVTSSDATDAAAWLTERLGAITDNVVIGTDADGCGVDVSALEDDGYFIRSLGDEVALLAKTAVGLDRAVRKYARFVEAGTGVADVTYHEGYRVERLTVAGNDISTYAIVRVNEDDDCVTTAATELATYIEKACGAKLAICTEAEFASSGAAHKIAISSGDESLGDEGFTITVADDGTLTIHGGRFRGSLYGVYGLLEDIGWRFIAQPDSYYDELVPKDRQEFLYEADHVDLTAEIDRTEIPSIPIRGGCLGLRSRNSYYSQYAEGRGGYGFVIRMSHGLQNNHDLIFSGEFEGVYKGYGVEGHQPCLTNGDVLDAIDNYALEYVRTRLDAGQQIGREIVCVDVAHWDGPSFCKCKNCEDIRILEGCICGTVLRMTNRVAALLAENYPGVSAGMLAYGVTEKMPRVTKPLANVVVSLTFWPAGTPKIIPCYNHVASGEECGDDIFNNKNFAADLDEWLEYVDPKMMQIWFYPFEDYFNYTSPIYRVLLKDMKFFADKKIEHVYYCMERNTPRNNGHICEGLTEYLGSKFMWNAYMTEEEGMELLREWFDIVYGEDAGDAVYELAMFAEQAGDAAGCWGCFSTPTRVNYEYVAKHADGLWDKCMRASELADDAAGERQAKRYITGIMYMIVAGCYNDMYVNGTDAERAVITERYRELYLRRCEIYGGDPAAFDPSVAP